MVTWRPQEVVVDVSYILLPDNEDEEIVVPTKEM
jgi:hypothetical protein